MKYLDKLKKGEEISCKKSATFGPKTEFGYPLKLDITINLSKKPSVEDGDNQYRLSIVGELKIKSSENLGLHAIESGGQCEDQIRDSLKSCGLVCKSFDMLYPIWKRWHLNDMTKGSPKQEKCLEEYYARYPDASRFFEDECEILKMKKIFVDKSYKIGGKPYEYGSRWLTTKIPEDVLRNLCKVMESDFEIHKKGKK